MYEETIESGNTLTISLSQEKRDSFIFITNQHGTVLKTVR